MKPSKHAEPTRKPRQPMASKPGVVGQNLIWLRGAVNMSQDMLASKSGVSRGTITNLERGARQNAGSQTITKLAVALGVQEQALIGSTSDAIARVVEELREEQDLIGEITLDELVFLRGLVFPSEVAVTKQAFAAMLNAYRWMRSGSDFAQSSKTTIDPVRKKTRVQ